MDTSRRICSLLGGFLPDHIVCLDAAGDNAPFSHAVIVKIVALSVFRRNGVGRHIVDVITHKDKAHFSGIIVIIIGNLQMIAEIFNADNLIYLVIFRICIDFVLHLISGCRILHHFFADGIAVDSSIIGTVRIDILQCIEQRLIPRIIGIAGARRIIFGKYVDHQLLTGGGTGVVFCNLLCQIAV